ncbi:MAG: hypothetical protein Q7R88_02715 [bacterium]|nr:hypothetical protein [bacterium]
MENQPQENDMTTAINDEAVLAIGESFDELTGEKRTHFLKTLKADPDRVRAFLSTNLEELTLKACMQTNTVCVVTNREEATQELMHYLLKLFATELAAV